MSDDLKRKMEERLSGQCESPFEATRRFLLSYVSDKDSMDEIEADIARMSRISSQTLRHGLQGIERLLAEPQHEDGQLVDLIAREVGWVLGDDCAKQWLINLAGLLRKHLRISEGDKSGP